jgi:hypothetical protein
VSVDSVWIINNVYTQLRLIFTVNLVPGLEIGLLIGGIVTVYIILFLNISFSALKPLRANECTMKF